MNSVLCWSAALGHESFPRVWLTYPVSVHWKKTLIFPFLTGINYNSFLVRGGNLCPLPFLVLVSCSYKFLNKFDCIPSRS